MNKFVRNNSWIEFYRSAEIRKNPKIRQASARIDLLSDEDQFSILLFEKKDPVKKQVKDYDRGQYLAKLLHFPDDSSIAEIINFSDIFDVMRGIIEANFRFVNENAAQFGKRGRSSWAYLTNFDFFNMANVSSKITALFKFDNHYAAQEKHFIIRTLQIEKFQEDTVSEICFFI